MIEVPRDPVVKRVNQLVTTFLDALGVLLCAAAAGWWAWTAVHPAAGFLAAGLTITILSVVMQREPKPLAVPDVPVEPPLPGPEDPGNLHVMGR